MLVGFHGYLEPAEAAFDRLQQIPGSNAWLLVAVQGLNRFYRGRTQDVVAGWMTRQDREVAIADNQSYVGAVVEEAAREWNAGETLVVAGFSQGVAMAYRAACASRRSVAGAIALGGDIPPELDTAALRRVRAALIGRGSRDEWYTGEKLAADMTRLHDAGVDVRTVELDAGHEWTPAFSEAAGWFLKSVGS